MGSDQFSLPYLGALARTLLDRIVASGAAGVDGRDADDWVLSRLIELKYAAGSTLDDTVFVCTPAGRHRWQIEILADGERAAAALRRQIIRHRLDERFTRLGINTSTALTAPSPAEPRHHRDMPELWSAPLQRKVRLSSALATVFAASAAALVVFSASIQPQEMRDWFFPSMPHAQTMLVGAPAAAAVAALVDLHAEEAPGLASDSGNVAPASSRRTASIDSNASGQKKGYDTITDLAQVGEAGRKGSSVVDAAWPNGGAILSWAVTARALIDGAVSKSDQIGADLATGIERFRSSAAMLIGSAMSESGQIAIDVTISVENSFKSRAAVLQHALVDMARTVFAGGSLTQQVRDDAPAPVTPAREPASEPEQPAVLQPAFASQTEVEEARAAIVYATPSEGVTAKGPTARGSEANADPQHAIVERLNRLSLAAARRGEAWRPNRLSDVAETGHRP